MSRLIPSLWSRVRRGDVLHLEHFQLWVEGGDHDTILTDAWAVVVAPQGPTTHWPKVVLLEGDYGAMVMDSLDRGTIVPPDEVPDRIVAEIVRRGLLGELT